MEPVQFIWMDGELVPWEDATTHVLSHALHYGTGVFEGIRAYETPDGPALFRLGDHMRRLEWGAKAYHIPMPFSGDDLAKATKEVVTRNDLESAYVRPLVFLGLGSMGLNPKGAEVHTIVAAWRWGAYLGEEGMRNGIRVRVSSWRRIDHHSLVPSAKGTGGYLNSILARLEADAGGYDEALLLNSKGYIAEGSGENVFMARDGLIHTPPPEAGALRGITHDTVRTLMRDEGHEVVETNMTRADLYYADEVFFTGTAAEVTPVREVDDRPVGKGKPGPITRRAQELYMATVTGRLDAYKHWLDYV